MITMKPLNFIDINHFTAIPTLELVQGNSATCYVQLFDDTTRYLPPVGSTVQVKFPRATSVAATPVSQDTTVTLAVTDQRDYSIYTMNLTSAQVNLIVSGGVILTIMSGGTIKSYPVDNFVRRKLNSPGA